MPAPKAPMRQNTAWRMRPPYSVRVKSLVELRKKNMPPLSTEQIKDLRRRLRHAVGFYIGRCNPSTNIMATQVVTLTAQNDKLREISTAAKNLARTLRNRKDHTAWLNRLRDAVDSNRIDSNTQTIITHHLHHIEIQWYVNFLDRIWDGRLTHGYYWDGGQMVKMDKDSFYAFADSLLPLLEHMAVLKAPATKMPRYADPNLHFLLTQFMIPLWIEVTGRTHKHGNNKEIPYYFYVWLSDTLGKADCKNGLSIDRVKKIARSFIDTRQIEK